MYNMYKRVYAKGGLNFVVFVAYAEGGLPCAASHSRSDLDYDVTLQCLAQALCGYRLAIPVCGSALEFL